ncbi:MAG: carboxypeptidase-like regulatory domain-containing protein [Acidobacteriaceae bacterium]
MPLWMLQLLSHIHNPVSAILVIVALILYRWRPTLLRRHQIVFVFINAALLGLAIIVIPTYSFLSQQRLLYRIHVTVLDVSHEPVLSTSGTSVKTSVGGEVSATSSGWRVDISPTSRPGDGLITIYASQTDGYLAGYGMLKLDGDYNKAITIQLAHEPEAVIRGIVVDRNNRPVAGAHVWIPGFVDSTQTDVRGNFSLPGHASEGQMINIRASKGRLYSNETVSVANNVTLVLVP